MKRYLNSCEDNLLYTRLALSMMFLTACTTGDGVGATDSSNKITLNSFEACLILGGPIMESYPRQCSLNGQHFTEDISTGQKGDRKSILFQIDPDRVDCMGVGPMTCYVVNGGLLYDEIEGFDFQPGQSRIIEVEREQYCDPNMVNGCPQDAGIYRYRYVRDMDKI